MADVSPPLEKSPTPEEQAELWQKVEKIRFAMLATRGAKGRIVSRPMTLQQAEPDGTLWFFTSIDTTLAAELAADPDVNASFTDIGDNFFLSASGRAALIDDRQKIEALWSPMVAAWYPGGPADPELTLLRIDAERVDYWSTTAGKLVQAMAMAKAALTRTPPGPAVGQHGAFTP